MPVNVTAPVANAGAHEHLQAAFRMLTQRGREIDAEVARLEALKAEKEIVRRELDVLNAALKVFGERESAICDEVQTEATKGSIPLDTQDAVVGATGDSSQNQQKEISEADAVSEHSASDSDGQRSIAGQTKLSQNGKSPGTKGKRIPEFTGNKTEFVRAVVRFRGAAGATPKDIDEVFAQHRIEKSKNVIYNALYSLVQQNKLKKKGGQYFYAEGPNK